VRALLFPQKPWSSRVQPATGVVNTAYEGATLASVRLDGVDPASHCGGAYDS
jgi:hypothetical protein